jgi:hypothetical protein
MFSFSFVGLGVSALTRPAFADLEAGLRFLLRGSNFTSFPRREKPMRIHTRMWLGHPSIVPKPVGDLTESERL